MPRYLGPFQEQQQAFGQEKAFEVSRSAPIITDVAILMTSCLLHIILSHLHTVLHLFYTPIMALSQV